MRSPCTKVCKIDKQTKICKGCKRTLEEISKWSSYDDLQRKKIMEQLKQR